MAARPARMRGRAAPAFPIVSSLGEEDELPLSVDATNARWGVCGATTVGRCSDVAMEAQACEASQRLAGRAAARLDRPVDGALPLVSILRISSLIISLVRSSGL